MRTMKKNLSREGGFTLIELLVVIAIVGLLSSVVLSSLKVAREKAIQSRVQQERHSLQNAFAIFYSNHGYYPDPGVDTRICIAEQPCFDANTAHNPWVIGDFAQLELPARKMAHAEGILERLGIARVAEAALGGLISGYPKNSPEVVINNLKYSGPLYSCNRDSLGKCSNPSILWTTKSTACDKGSAANGVTSSNGTLCQAAASGEARNFGSTTSPSSY
jgi:prepilin-type N-terminal cleavage/methylation domain-containing protein